MAEPVWTQSTNIGKLGVAVAVMEDGEVHIALGEAGKANKPTVIPARAMTLSNLISTLESALTVAREREAAHPEHK